MRRHLYALGVFFIGGFAYPAFGQAIVQIADHTYSSGQVVAVRANETISTSGLVQAVAGSNVTFQAGDKITLTPGFKVSAGAVFKARIALNKAQFIRQTVPALMTPNQIVPVIITLRNNGNSSWTAANNVKLGTQSAEGNTLWTGSDRVLLQAGETIAPGQVKVFNFTITAPAITGQYAFQWMMIQEGVEWFGEMTPLKMITVGGSSDADADFDGLPDGYTTDTNGDGVPDAVERALGLDPTQTQPDASARSKSFNYDNLNRLIDGPGRAYNLDPEGNIEGP